MNTKFQVGDIVRTTRDSDGPYYKKGALGQLVARTDGQEWHVKFSGMNNPEGSFDPDCDGTWYVSENRFEAAPTVKLTLPIVVGKKYVRRDGQVVTIALAEGHQYWDSLVTNGYTQDGRVTHINQDPQAGDLVSDYIEPAKGHPHAALMMEFAKDAAESETPWDRWEKRYTPMAPDWEACDSAPAWAETCQYRRRPEVKPDPHAENAAEYAKDMAQTDKAWQRWEVKGPGCIDWEDLNTHPCWFTSFFYRRKEQA